MVTFIIIITSFLILIYSIYFIICLLENGLGGILKIKKEIGEIKFYSSIFFLILLDIIHCFIFIYYDLNPGEIDFIAISIITITTIIIINIFIILEENKEKSKKVKKGNKNIDIFTFFSKQTTEFTNLVLKRISKHPEKKDVLKEKVYNLIIEKKDDLLIGFFSDSIIVNIGKEKIELKVKIIKNILEKTFYDKNFYLPLYNPEYDKEGYVIPSSSLSFDCIEINKEIINSYGLIELQILVILIERISDGFHEGDKKLNIKKEIKEINNEILILENKIKDIELEYTKERRKIDKDINILHTLNNTKRDKDIDSLFEYYSKIEVSKDKLNKESKISILETKKLELINKIKKLESNNTSFGILNKYNY